MTLQPQLELLRLLARHGVPFGCLDFFDYVPGFPDVGVDELLDQSVLADGLRYASQPWLKRMKKAAGRLPDLADLEHLP